MGFRPQEQEIGEIIAGMIACEPAVRVIEVLKGRFQLWLEKNSPRSQSRRPTNLPSLIRVPIMLCSLRARLMPMTLS